MSAHKKLTGKDFAIKPALTQYRKIGGRVVETELENPTFTDEDVDDLMDGVTSSEIEAGREKLMRENPNLASKQVHDILDKSASDMNFEDGDFANARELSSSKRFGSIIDKESNETIDFRRLTNGTVQLTNPSDGEVVSSLSEEEFGNLLDSDEFAVI